MTSRGHSFKALQPLLLAAAALALLLGSYCPPAHARASTFQGVAGLCLFDPTGVTEETKGGITFSYGLRMGYRIETDHELINGWEILISNTRTNKGGNAFYFGNSTLEPTIAPGSTLEGKFFFASDANPIKGNYFGTGDLERVVVHYELVPADLSALVDFCDGMPPMFGYLMSGTVKNYRAP
jgi:hypothetical protein